MRTGAYLGEFERIRHAALEEFRVHQSSLTSDRLNLRHASFTHFCIFAYLGLKSTLWACYLCLFAHPSQLNRFEANLKGDSLYHGAPQF